MASRQPLGLASPLRPSLLLALAPGEELDRLAQTLGATFDLLTASSHEGALEVLRNHQVDLIVTDLQLAGVNGTEWLSQSNVLCPSAKRLLAGTQTEAPAVIEALGKGHAHGFARKPLVASELQALLDDFVARQRLERENARLSEELRETVKALDHKEQLLRTSLNKRGRELLRANTQLEQVNGELLRVAFRDGLTGLYNHRGFQERLREEISRARRYRKPVTLLLADLDDFKTYNIRHGHGRGDQLLKLIADLLSSQVRGCDISARFSGEQFSILLPETTKEGGRIKADRLRELCRSAPLPGIEVLPGGRLTLSISVAEFPSDARTAEELLSRADHALYVSKRAGRDRVQLHGDEGAPAEEWSQGPAVESPSASRGLRMQTYQQRMPELTAILESDRLLGCLLIDLDRLRPIEQAYGSVTHASVLRRAGAALAEMRGARIREQDLLCRLEDADAFVIFLAPQRPEQREGADLRSLGELEAMAERIAAWIDRAIGGDVFDLLRDTPRTAVGYARILHNAMFSPERQISSLISEARESAVLMRRRRLQRDKEKIQELILLDGLQTHYQPIVNFDSREIFGYEALTRGPRKTPLESPLALFAAAEDVDLLFELDRACFRGALRHAAGLQPVHRLFVNILPPSFYDHSFVGAEVDKLLKSISLEPANVVFEITERLAIDNFTNFRRALNTYTDAGFGVAIDDVGTKHSNLEAVIALRPNFVKVSDVMTRGIAQSGIKREMIKSLLKFSQSIDAMIVAEGIETQSDMACLCELGVRYGQGFHLARPGPPFPTLRPAALRGIGKPAP